MQPLLQPTQVPSVQGCSLQRSNRHALGTEHRVNSDLLADVDISHFNQAVAHGRKLIRAFEAKRPAGLDRNQHFAIGGSGDFFSKLHGVLHQEIPFRRVSVWAL
jgi:hypothetical protein